VIGGVEGVYDRHSYFDEKRDVLERLSSIVGQIVGRRVNVIELREAS
jgi:hypothetical protein